MGQFTEALASDLALLEARDLLRGRASMVEIARRHAALLDTFDGFTPWNAARFVEVLRDLGIARVEANLEPDEFTDLVAQMDAAAKAVPDGR